MKPCLIEELLSTFKGWLYTAEDYNIVAPVIAALANFCAGDPDIVGIIAPSGSNKTEIIRSFGEAENEYVYPVSSITEHSLVSGHEDSQDIVPELKHRLLTIKDFTTILSKKDDTKAGIFADFREIQDGYIKKVYGNGITKEYTDIHSSVLFGCTNAIEKYNSLYSSLGQRIIFVRPKNNPKEARKRNVQNQNKKEVMRKELNSVMLRFLSHHINLIISRGLPKISEEIHNELGERYDFLAVVRTSMHHNYKTGAIDEIPEPEFPTRIAATFSRFCALHALIYGRTEAGPAEYEFIKRGVLDNIPTDRNKVLFLMGGDWETTASIAEKANLDTGATRYILNELLALEIVVRKSRDNKEDGENKRSDSFRLLEKWIPVIDQLTPRNYPGPIWNEETKSSKNNNNIPYPIPWCLLTKDSQPILKTNFEISGYLESNGEVGKQKFLDLFPPVGIAPAKVLAFDFETIGGEVKYLSNKAKGKAKVRLDPRKATPRLISFATEVEGGCGLLRPEEWELLIPVLADPSVVKLGHNLAYDLGLIRATLGRRLVVNNLFDTMLANQLLIAGIYDKSLKHSGLKEVVKSYLGHELDKSLQVSDWSGIPTKGQLEYALKDSQILIPLREVLKQKLEKNGLTEVAQIEFDCIPVTVEVAQTGLPFDTEAAQDKIVVLDTELSIISGKLNEIVLKSGWQSPTKSKSKKSQLFNPASAKHLLALLKLEYRDNSDIPNSSDATIKALAVKYPDKLLAKLIQDYRALTK